MFFLSVSNLKLSLSSEPSSSYLNRRLKAFVIKCFCWLKSSQLYRFTSSIVSSMIHVWSISKNEITLLKVFLLLFIRYLLFIIGDTRYALLHHWMWAKLKMSCSELLQLFLIKLLWVWGIMDVMKMSTWDLWRIFISKLKVRALKSSCNLLWVNMISAFLWSKLSLMSCFHCSTFFSKHKVSLSNIFVRCFFLWPISWKVFVSCVVHWDEMSRIFAILKVMSPHPCLSIQLCLLFFWRHVSLLSLIMKLMSCVIVLRMISKSKMTLSKILFCLFI